MKRDEFILAVTRWAQENRWKGMGFAGWPSFEDAGGEMGFIQAALSLTEDIIPDDVPKAVNEFIAYGLVANPYHYSEDERAKKRPLWLPDDWKWKWYK